MLNVDVLTHIFSYLYPIDLYSSSLVCPSWYEASKSENLWHQFGVALGIEEHHASKIEVKRKIVSIKTAYYGRLEERFANLCYLRFHGWVTFDHLVLKAEAIYKKNSDKRPLLTVIADMVTEEKVQHRGIQLLRSITLSGKKNLGQFLYKVLVKYSEKKQEDKALAFCSEYFQKLHSWNVPRTKSNEANVISSACTKFLLHAQAQKNYVLTADILALIWMKYRFICSWKLLQRISC